MPIVLKDMKFVHTLVDLLNQKLQQPGEVSETLSGKEQLFGGACCVDVNEDKCPVNENECSDVNELILKKVINKDFTSLILDLFLHHNFVSPQVKFCHNICQQVNFIHSLLVELRRAMNGTMRRSTAVARPIFIFNAATHMAQVHFQLTDLEKRSIVIEPPVTLAPDINIGDQFVAIRNSQTYIKVRDHLFNNFQKVDKMEKFMSKKMPVILPCSFYGREQMNEKALIIYMELYRFSKYLISILILKAMTTELRHEPIGPFNPDPLCKNIKDTYFRNIPQRDNCKNNVDAVTNIRYKLMNDIFQDLFGMFANDARIAAA
jgi:hypothetical protein